MVIREGFLKEAVSDLNSKEKVRAGQVNLDLDWSKCSPGGLATTSREKAPVYKSPRHIVNTTYSVMLENGVCWGW